MSLLPITNANDSNPLPMQMCNLLDMPNTYTSDRVEWWLNQNNIYHIPLQVYQEMYLFASQNVCMEHKQVFVRKHLLAWIAEEHPDKELANFCDLSTEEARAVHPNLDCGMWVYLLPKPKAQNVFDHDKINARIAELRKYPRTEQDCYPAIKDKPDIQVYHTGKEGIKIWKDAVRSAVGGWFEEEELDPAKLPAPAQKHLPTEKYLFSGMSAEQYRKQMLGDWSNEPKPTNDEDTPTQ